MSKEMQGKSARAYTVDYDGSREIRLTADSDGSYLGSMQRVVDGLIEPFNVLFDDVELYVDGDGLYSKPANRAVTATPEMAERGYLSMMSGASDRIVRAGELYTVLHGPILAVAYGPDGDLRDISDAEIAEVAGYFNRPEHGPLSGYSAECRILSRMRERN